MDYCKNEFRSYEKEFPNYRFYLQKYIGLKKIPLNAIVGGIFSWKFLFNRDFSIKIRNKRYNNLLRYFQERGIENLEKSLNELNKKQLIHLACFVKDEKRVYYVMGDGHRRVSIAKKYNAICINAEVDEYIVDNQSPIIKKKRKNYYYFYAVDFFYESDGRKKNYTIIEKLGKITKLNYSANEVKINKLIKAKASERLKEFLENY